MVTTMSVNVHVDDETRIASHVGKLDCGRLHGWIDLDLRVCLHIQAVAQIDRIVGALDELRSLMVDEAGRKGEYGGDPIPTDDEVDEWTRQEAMAVGLGMHDMDDGTEQVAL